jgi:hypothetical protein
MYFDGQPRASKNDKIYFDLKLTEGANGDFVL